MPGQEIDGDKVMNSTLKTSEISFMASDSGQEEVIMGSSISLAFAGESTESEKLHGFFTGLSEGGKVTMPLSPVPWGAEFGMFTDKFGINWMFNIDVAAPVAA